ncbi:MAG: hypothetical protein RJA99_4297 [Pseudomonadota bacterium]|jgi:predicted transcriptional regulator
MKQMLIRLADERDFFQRGREIARRADAGQPLASAHVISFEDPHELLRLLGASRIDVLRAVKKEPGSITQVAQRLGRDRSAVKRDIEQLEYLGMVNVETKVLPGHGRMKEVRATARKFRLEAEVE